MKGWCHWERDCLSFLQLIIDTQRADGMFYELVKQLDDGHWTMVDDTSRVLFPEDNLALARLDLEADVEYVTVEAAHLYWRMTGDDRWMASVLPKLEKAIRPRGRTVASTRGSRCPRSTATTRACGRRWCNLPR